MYISLFCVFLCVVPLLSFSLFCVNNRLIGVLSRSVRLRSSPNRPPINNTLNRPDPTRLITNLASSLSPCRSLCSALQHAQPSQRRHSHDPWRLSASEQHKKRNPKGGRAEERRGNNESNGIVGWYAMVASSSSGAVPSCV